MLILVPIVIGTPRLRPLCETAFKTAKRYYWDTRFIRSYLFLYSVLVFTVFEAILAWSLSKARGKIAETSQSIAGWTNIKDITGILK
jgi:hypothetical protein